MSSSPACENPFEAEAVKPFSEPFCPGSTDSCISTTPGDASRLDGVWEVSAPHCTFKRVYVKNGLAMHTDSVTNLFVDEKHGYKQTIHCEGNTFSYRWAEDNGQYAHVSQHATLDTTAEDFHKAGYSFTWTIDSQGKDYNGKKPGDYRKWTRLNSAAAFRLDGVWRIDPDDEGEYVAGSTYAKGSKKEAIALLDHRYRVMHIRYGMQGQHMSPGLTDYRPYQSYGIPSDATFTSEFDSDWSWCNEKAIEQGWLDYKVCQRVTGLDTTSPDFGKKGYKIRWELFGDDVVDGMSRTWTRVAPLPGFEEKGDVVKASGIDGVWRKLDHFPRNGDKQSMAGTMLKVKGNRYEEKVVHRDGDRTVLMEYTARRVKAFGHGSKPPLPEHELCMPWKSVTLPGADKVPAAQTPCKVPGNLSGWRCLDPAQEKMWYFHHHSTSPWYVRDPDQGAYSTDAIGEAKKDPRFNYIGATMTWALTYNNPAQETWIRVAEGSEEVVIADEEEREKAESLHGYWKMEYPQHPNPQRRAMVCWAKCTKENTFAGMWVTPGKEMKLADQRPIPFTGVKDSEGNWQVDHLRASTDGFVPIPGQSQTVTHDLSQGDTLYLEDGFEMDWKTSPALAQEVGPVVRWTRYTKWDWIIEALRAGLQDDELYNKARFNEPNRLHESLFSCIKDPGHIAEWTLFFPCMMAKTWAMVDKGGSGCDCLVCLGSMFAVTMPPLFSTLSCMLRAKYMINWKVENMTPFSPLVIGCCCPACSNCQIWRELDAKEKSPGGMCLSTPSMERVGFSGVMM